MNVYQRESEVCASLHFDIYLDKTDTLHWKKPINNDFNQTNFL